MFWDDHIPNLQLSRSATVCFPPPMNVWYQGEVPTVLYSDPFGLVAPMSLRNEHLTSIRSDPQDPVYGCGSDGVDWIRDTLRSRFLRLWCFTVMPAYRLITDCLTFVFPANAVSPDPYLELGRVSAILLCSNIPRFSSRLCSHVVNGHIFRIPVCSLDQSANAVYGTDVIGYCSTSRHFAKAWNTTIHRGQILTTIRFVYRDQSRLS
jgi:hypothetical protein